MGMKVLVNDGLHNRGIWLMEDAGIEVVDTSIPQDDLPEKLPEFDGIIVRSATQVRQELIDICPNLKFIGRGGVGLDNIDVDYAEQKGIRVFNTPAASSRSVAELVFGHIISISRGIHQSNREMPLNGRTNFKQLKKRYSKGMELEGKNLGIIGMGRIGTESARIGVGLGMRVRGSDPFVEEKKIGLDINSQQVYTTIECIPLEQLLADSDVITIHVPGQDSPIIGEKEIEIMREGVILINASRGGIIDEEALLRGLDTGKILGAGLDVFKDEPLPDEAIIKHPSISSSPHIGASTYSAQEKIGVELAHKIIGLLTGDNGRFEN